MFEDRGLSALRAKYPHHPAVLQFDALDQLSQQLARRNANTTGAEDMFRGVARFQADRSSWASDPKGDDYWSFVEDRRARAQIRSRIGNPNDFGDVITELYVWGRLREHVKSCQLIETPGKADLLVTTASPSVEIAGEVKRIHRQSDSRRVRKSIAKGSKQIYATLGDSNVGDVFLHIETGDNEIQFGTRPHFVSECLVQVRRELGSNSSSHVGRVIVLWDEFFRMSHDLLALRRNVEAIARTNSGPQEIQPPWELGMTMMMLFSASGPGG